MKPVAVVLVVSVALNALLIVGFARRGIPTAADRSTPAPGVPSPRSSGAAASGTNAPATAQTLLALEPAALHASLQRMNLPRTVVDALVMARIYARHDARRQELVRETSQLPWWKTAAVSLGAMNLFTPDQRKELRDLDAAACNEVMRVLGPEALDRDGAIAARFNFVDPGRAIQLEAMLRDYEDLGAMLREEMRGLRTRADREREAFLAAERQRDVDKLLQPRAGRATHFDGRVHHEPQCEVFRRHRDGIPRVYELQKGYHEDQEAARVAPLESRGRSGIERSQKFQRDLEAALGAERYVQWQRAQQEEYTMLLELQRRFAIPPATLDAVAAVPRQISEEGVRIAKDETRSRDERTLALRDLADEGRRRVTAILGDDLGEAYNASFARGWLDHLERGSVPFLLPNGQRALFGVGNPGRTRTPPRK